MTPRLLKKNSLTFTRKSPDTGYIDRGVWVEGTELPETIQTTGNLQPYREGKIRQDFPEGIRIRHVKVYYTKTLLYGFDDKSSQEPDTTTIDGVKYVVYDIEDWFTPAYRSANYKAYLVREDDL